MTKQRVWLWSNNPDRGNWTEHISTDWEHNGGHSITVEEMDDDRKVVLFDARDEPLVTEPYRRKMGYK